jgi:hypothetical protein
VENYRISLDTNINWNIFIDERSGFSLNIGANISNVLRLVKNEFESIFGKATVDSHPTLSVHHTNNVPQTFRTHRLIFLSAYGDYYLQYIYQFSHELCHFMVPSEVCDSFRWFEETLCQAMSWFILQRIFDKQVVPPCRELAYLYPTIEGYIADDMRNRYSLNGISLPNYIAQNQDYLRGNYYDRQMNAAIAYGIYPLLMEYPELWAIVLHLHKLNEDMDLSEAIQFLIHSAGVEKVGGDQLVQWLTKQCLVVTQRP